MTTIKEQVDKATIEVEEKIRALLQSYHDETGMIPRSVNLNIVDASEHGKPRLVIVTRITLHATT